MIKLTNTYGGQKVPFVPINNNQVGIYVCGVTVYDLCHLGHGRTFVAFDTIVRYLRFSGYNVKFVRNITDIDDKIIARSQETGESWQALVNRMTTKMHRDFTALNILPPDVEPRPTEHIPQIIKMIDRLIARGHAYIAPDGDVMFSTETAKDYGKLSGQNLNNLKSGARVSVNTQKTNPLDFVLWKQAKPGEPAWTSPWGAGRPGWHIECSAMNSHHLGTHFDIHGGGSDLIFPHHENEIAQSTSANDGPYVNYWLHTGMVTVNQEKMSKSLNNFMTLREMLAHHDGEVLRLFYISGHYRKPLNFSQGNLDAARSSLARLYSACRLANGKKPADHAVWLKHFQQVMDDDFNTPKALAVMFELVRIINQQVVDKPDVAGALATTLKELGNILGLLTKDPTVYLQTNPLWEPSRLDDIKNRIKEREEARKNKEWQRADNLRAWLEENGVELEDKDGKTLWKAK
ncbi:TPA: cysteine--tRNA ligase [Klebsiella variicola]|uniref:cysteine--tRNA ligase n=1 Tax=Klebsiella variicola TaxID=244366 RepID=UPI0007CC5556|nr:cysteine--tRNA ligase [Klebsiella variicola]PXJ81704.1 cysteine--tRNA ligase [Klebsiella variicola]SBK83254.1 cysteinyl-tRNA synthetase [Klebsiella variicola]HCL6959823.1 cysteine--tRNA ligase [Klebsiella variicola]